MPPPEVRKYLFDIAEACALIERFTAGKSFDDYTGDLGLLKREIDALLDEP